jgi:hypothetical protein
MKTAHVRGSELRRLASLLAEVLQDSELMAHLSLIEREHLEGAAEALEGLLPVVDERDLEDTLSES